VKLFYSPFHNFAHKTLVVAHEVGLWDRITLVPSFPFRNLQREFVTGQYDLSPIAPLRKVPLLALEDGSVLYGSQTIAEYLDARGAAETGAQRLYPPDGPARWSALTRLALGDSIFDFAVQLSMESWVLSEQRRLNLYEWLWPKIISALDALEESAGATARFDIGWAGVLQGVSYLAARTGADDPVQPNFDWRAGRPGLAAWYDAALQRPSVQAHVGKDYEGDTSPENHRLHVQEVLAARQR